MTAIRFNFDTDFDGGASKKEEQRRALQLQELDQTRVQAIEEGVNAGRQEALSSIEAQTAELLQQIGASLQQFYGQFHALESQIKSDSINLAYSIASRLVPTLLDKQPEAEILNLISECIESNQIENSLTIRVNTAMEQHLAPHMGQLETSLGEGANLKLIADDHVGIQDCQIEWSNGGAQRDWQAVNEQIETTINQWLALETNSHTEE